MKTVQRKPEFHSYSKGITRQKTVILQFNPDRHDGSFLLVLCAETNALSITSVRIYFSPLHVEAVKKNHACLFREMYIFDHGYAQFRHIFSFLQLVLDEHFSKKIKKKLKSVRRFDRRL